jgi:DNA-binding transcriptional ArsR family regulator
MSPSDPEDKDLQRVDDIDRTIHSPTRLKIIAVLAAVENADFTFLLRATGLTRGNLSANLRTLEEAGYVSIQKEFVVRTPRTIVRLADEGRNAMQVYRENMRMVLDELLGDLE